MRRENTLIIGIICLMTCVVALTASTYGNFNKKNEEHKQTQITEKPANKSIISILSVN